jgi:TonB family protein
MSAAGLLTTGVYVLGWCLLHFLWQAAVVGAGYWLARGLLPRGNPRYLAAMLAMLVMAACPVGTAWHELSINAVPADLGGAPVAAASVAASPQAEAPVTWWSLLNVALPWLVLAWAVGVSVLGVRVFRQWLGLRAMVRMAEKLPQWQVRARHFADRLGLRRVVPVVASVRVATPTLVGWLRPAVVLPLAVLARMPAAQIDLVLAHELAHLKRFDHIANLFQVVLETLFFYHPVLHRISREARNERELCCDALALRVTDGERRDFVEALASLEELRAGHADLALAASGGLLVERAWFIAGAAPRHPRRPLRGNAVLVLAVAAVLGLGWSGWRDFAWQQRIATQVAANNASVLRYIRQDTERRPNLLPYARVPSNFRLPRVPDANLSVALPDARMPVARIQVSTVGRPGLTLQHVSWQPPPVAIPSVSVNPEDTGAARDASVTPEPLHTVRPVYPSEALLGGIQGQVVVEFVLDAGGAPRNLRVVQSTASQFDASALQAMAGWRFAPPALPGRRYRQAFTFRLGETAGNAAAAPACLVMTGTHICRHAFDAVSDVHVLRTHR